MTDQNQTQDPQNQGTQQTDPNLDPNTSQNSDVFGGGGDIFENSDILEPIDGINKDKKIDENATIPGIKVDAPIEDDVEENVAEEKEPEIVETMPEAQKIDEVVEDNKNDDFFDPFNDDEGVLETKDSIPEPKEKEEEIAEETETEEEPEIVENDIPDFENSPEIDALDDIDNLNELNENKTQEKKGEEIAEETETEEVVEKEKVNIESTIERIERRAKEAKLAAERAEQAVEEKKEDKEDEKEKIEDEEVIKDVAEDTIDEDIKDENIDKTEEDDKSQTPVIAEEDNIEIKTDDHLKTDLQNKFSELVAGAKNIYTLLGQDADEWFDIVWGNDDRMKTTYNIIMWEENIEIKKIELNKSDNKVQEYRLEFVVDKASLNVKIDDELLYDEVTDLQENANKKMQVMEKLNKFIFLVTEELKKLEKEKWKKEKRNIMKWIFRNFMF